MSLLTYLDRFEYAAGEHKQHARNQPVAADYVVD